MNSLQDLMNSLEHCRIALLKANEPSISSMLIQVSIQGMLSLEDLPSNDDLNQAPGLPDLALD